jgi:hypothetical protein
LWVFSLLFCKPKNLKMGSFLGWKTVINLYIFKDGD